MRSAAHCNLHINMGKLKQVSIFIQERATKGCWIILLFTCLALVVITTNHDSYGSTFLSSNIRKLRILTSDMDTTLDLSNVIPFNDPIAMGEEAVFEAQEEFNKKHFSRKSGRHKHAPHCIIAGVRKAGTRALLEFLNLHPDIAALMEEEHFFETNSTYYRGITQYLRKMPISERHQIVVTKRPRYFFTTYVPERIQMMNSSMRIIVVVRNPVNRMVSEYVHFDVLKGNDVPFESLALLPNGEVNTEYRPLRNSKYYYNFKRWLDYFPRNQIHIVNGDQLIDDPFDEIQKVETFLGLRHAIKDKQLFYDEEKGFYCYKTGRKGSKTKQCLGRTKGRSHPDVDEKILEKLKEHLEHYNEMFYDLVGENFAW